MYYRGSAAAIVVYDITNQVRSVSLISFSSFVFILGCCGMKYPSYVCVLVLKVYNGPLSHCRFYKPTEKFH